MQAGSIPGHQVLPGLSGQPAQRAPLGLREPLVLQERLALQAPPEQRAQQVALVRLGVSDRQGLQVQPESLALLGQLARRALPEELVQQEVLGLLELQEPVHMRLLLQMALRAMSRLGLRHLLALRVPRVRQA